MLYRSILRSYTARTALSGRLPIRKLNTAAALPPRREYIPVSQRGIYDAAYIAMTKQWKLTKSKAGQKRQRLSERDPETLNWPDGNHSEVLQLDILELLRKPRRSEIISQPESKAIDDVFDSKTSDEFHEVELEIEELASTSDGLARSPYHDHVFVVPFALPGEKVLARVRKTLKLDWSEADLIKVLEPSKMREGVTPACKYFASCSGCQLQMLPYDEQVAHKKTVVEKAYQNFSGLKSHQVPQVAETGISPRQYGYRTKLTPHFDGPARERGREKERKYTSVPPIGFTFKGRKKVMDIESCPIGTEIVQEGLKKERTHVATNISKYKNGATLLLRETTERSLLNNKSETSSNPPPDTNSEAPTANHLNSLPQPTSKTLTTTFNDNPQLTLTYPTLGFEDHTTYTHDMNGMSTEYIGSYKFTTRAGAFFQNNNSILPSFLSYIRDHALPGPHPTIAPAKYLLDAYSGAGLFALTLSPLFQSVLGIEIDPSSVAHARTNAVENNVSNCGFIEADASDLFADVPYPNEQTVVVIDPPRKGCSKSFLRQLLGFGAMRVVYVSCNVNSQARDVGVMVRGGFVGESELESGWKYEIESLKGWDFFPQTGHVEGVCILNRVEKDKKKTEVWGEE